MVTAVDAAGLFATGLAAGFLGGIVGTGGCVIMLPILALVFNYPIAEAIGTTVFAVIWTAAFGAINHGKLGNVDKDTGSIVMGAGAIGALVGSVIFAYLMSYKAALEVILGLAFLYAAVRMFYEGVRKIPGAEGDHIPGPPSKKAAIGFGIGILTGILGLGGGYALVPCFIYLLNAPVHIAVGTSMISMVPMATVSAAYKMAQHVVDLIAGTLLGIGTIIGVRYGARVAAKIPAHYIKLLFGIYFGAVAIKFILSGLGIKVPI